MTSAKNLDRRVAMLEQITSARVVQRVVSYRADGSLVPLKRGQVLGRHFVLRPEACSSSEEWLKIYACADQREMRERFDSRMRRTHEELRCGSRPGSGIRREALMRVVRSAGLLIALVALLGCDRGASQGEAARAQRRANNEAHLAKGAFIESTKAISADEEISVLVVPQGRGARFDDKRCLIYRHKGFRTASIACESETSVIPE
jgi:hypothetical protein